jgi:uncharacterized membrane protein
MIPRPRLHTFAAAMLAVAAAAGCRSSPTDPSRPGTYVVTFLGAPADAESFMPRAVSAGRVVGVAATADRTWSVQWVGGAFSRIGPELPAGCHSEPLAARGAFTVGQVTCTAGGSPAGQPVDVYGWISGEPVPARIFAEPFTYVGVTSAGTMVGTVNPRAQFPTARSRAFLRSGGSATVLVPPGAVASEAVGITEAGEVVVTAYFDCPAIVDDDDPCRPSQAFVWTGGVWTAIPVPSRTERTVAAAVGSRGHVGGYAFGEADGVFLYRIPRRDLDGLPVIPGTRVVLTGANALGQVVGTGVRDETAGRAVSYGIVWGDERQYDITERLGGSERWQVTSALAADDNGRIAGTGIRVETGVEGAILLVPTTLR